MKIRYPEMPQIFCHSHTQTHTDRHFPEVVKSCSGHPKTCKSTKNRKSKIFKKPILSSVYVEENQKLLQVIFIQVLRHDG